MEEIPNNHQPQLVRRISSINSSFKDSSTFLPWNVWGKFICTPWNSGGNDSESDLRSMIFSDHLTTYVVRIVGESDKPNLAILVAPEVSQRILKQLFLKGYLSNEKKRLFRI